MVDGMIPELAGRTPIWAQIFLTPTGKTLPSPMVPDPNRWLEPNCVCFLWPTCGIPLEGGWPLTATSRGDPTPPILPS